MEKILKKLNIFNLALLVVLVVLLVTIIYYCSKFTANRVKIQNAEELNEEIYITNVIKGKYVTKIEARISLNPENLQEYKNYVHGPNKGYYINYQLVLENKEKQYKIKTMYKGIEDGKAVVVGHVYNSFYNKGNFTIGIVQKNYKNGQEVTRYGIIDFQEKVGEKQNGR